MLPNNKHRLFTRYCRRCGVLFKTESRTHKAVCSKCNCNLGKAKILRVRDNIYYTVNRDAKKFSKDGLILNPNAIIDAYQKVIKKFKLSKELERVLHNGKNK